MFNDLHKSNQDSNRVILYDLSLGGTTWNYTSSNMNVVVSGVTYLHAPGIDNSEIHSSGDEQRNEVKLMLSSDLPLPIHVMKYIPSQEILLVIKSIEVDDPDSQVIEEWSGRYLEYEVNYPKFSMTFAPIERDMMREVLSPSYGIDCQLSQYDQVCGLAYTSFGVSAEITAVDGLQITVDINLSLPAVDHFVGGFVVASGLYGSEFSFILDTPSSSVIELDRAIPELTIGNTLTVVPSCRGEISRCDSIFSNRIKYLGAPYANKVNPFSGSVKGEF
jgi:hypothetical protein